MKYDWLFFTKSISLIYKSKIFQKKDDNKPSAFEHDISLKDAKSLKVELSSFVYNDFNPDSDEYEEQEVSVKKSDDNLRSKTVKVSKRLF